MGNASLHFYATFLVLKYIFQITKPATHDPPTLSLSLVLFNTKVSLQHAIQKFVVNTKRPITKYWDFLIFAHEVVHLLLPVISQD